MEHFADDDVQEAQPAEEKSETHEPQAPAPAAEGAGEKVVSAVALPTESATAGRLRAERWSDSGYAAAPTGTGCGRLSTLRPARRSNRPRL